MKGTKLVSDLITDLRLTNQQKEHLYLLWSGDEVVWVVGYRGDDRFKLKPATREALKLTIELI
jgi:tRNA(Ile)-lysidine synthase